MPIQPSAPKCPACGKSVYAAEEVKALGQSWHNLCFCCKACSKSLRGGCYKEHGGWPYCEADHAKLFGPKGIGYGQTLGDTGIGRPAATATPESGVVEAAAEGPAEAVPAAEGAAVASPAKATDAAPPAEEGSGATPVKRGSLLSAGAPKCPKCGRSVFAAEEVRALDRSWHPGCFCCKECGKSLRAGQYRDCQGVPYCDADYRRLFGGRGAGAAPAPAAPAASASAVPPSAAKEPAASASAAPVLGAAGVGSEAEGGGVAAQERAAVSSPGAAEAGGAAEEAGPRPSLRERMAAFQKAPEAAPAPVSRSAPSAARFQANNPKCPACDKSVYAAEEVKGLGRSWHALCFCCKACNKSLRGGCYKEHDGWPYCEADHGKLFGPKGIGFGATLGDTGIGGAADAVQGSLAAPQAEVAEGASTGLAAQAKAFGGAATSVGAVSGAAPRCPKCGKSVYAAEEVLALGRSWHPSCFCCAACGRSLRGGQYREHDGEPYCEADHARLFGAKGIGFGNTLGDTGVAGAPDAGSS